MYLSIILIPLLGSIFSGLFGRKLGAQGSQFITTFGLILTCIFSFIAFYEVGLSNSAVSLDLFSWIDSEYFLVKWGFTFDSLTVLFAGFFSIKGTEAVLVLIQLYKKIFIQKFLICWLKYSSFQFISLKRFPFNYPFRVNKIFGLNKGMNYSTIKDIDLNNEKSSLDSNFLEWFVGFSDAESCLIINRLLKKDNFTISKFSFMFKIALHNFLKGVRFVCSTPNMFPPSTLNPNWVTGFVDAEGSFIITVRGQKGPLGWRVSPIFTIHLHNKDLHLLYKFQSFFKVGNVHTSKKSASFTVERIEDIVNVIIPHFKEYPLQSAKSIDFNLWSKCVEIINNKEHLTFSGLKKIVRFKSALNKGLPEYLINSFPDVMERPTFKVSTEPLNPYWISGFTEGDGSFFISISEKTNQVRMFYSIKLNNREAPLILKIQEYFKGIGSIVHDNYNNLVQYNIASIKNINETIIPQFDTYRFYGNKLTNYIIWKEILMLVNSKAHLTVEGLDKIRDLKSTLNQW